MTEPWQGKKVFTARIWFDKEIQTHVMIPCSECGRTVETQLSLGNLRTRDILGSMMWSNLVSRLASRMRSFLLTETAQDPCERCLRADPDRYRP